MGKRKNSNVKKQEAMKSPTESFKDGLPKRVTVIDAPAPLTRKEIEHYEYWLALQSFLPCLYKEPKDKETKDILREFMAMYAKIKMAMQAVKPGEVNVKIGESLVDGQDLVVAGEWYDTPQKEADFAVSFFTAFLSSEINARAILKAKAQVEDELERETMRRKDLENAVEKLEHINAVRHGRRSLEYRRCKGVSK